MMKTVENFPQIAEEFAAQNVKLIGVHGAAPAYLVSRERTFADLSDWNGALVMSISANTVAILEAMGCSVMSDNPTQIYDSMSKGVYNSLLIDYQAVDAFGVSDLITSALNYNFGSVMGYVAMNLDVYNSLPADLQELLDSKFEEISLLFGGKMNDSAIKGLTGHDFEIVEPSEEVKEAIIKATEETVLPTYLSSCEAVGVNGQEIIDFASKTLEEAYEIYGTEYNWIK
jgi:TRAP-type C4-dicarboxylate transport system substrate-binding protein